MRVSDLVLSLLIGITPALAIWPIPKTISTGDQTLWIEHNIQVTYNGGILPWYDDDSSSQATTVSSKEIVLGGVCRALSTILDKSFVPWKLYARNAVKQTEPSADRAKTCITELVITKTGNDSTDTWKPLDGTVDESYSLSVGLDGSAKIEAVSAVGILHALETFTQLFYKHSTSGIYTTLAPVDIKDAPKFPHRGILFDVARDFYPVPSILKTLDAMAQNKLNRLHIHATDSQSWPLEIPSMPELTEKGAYASVAVYSADDIAHIQQYAVQRGIEVIIEIDTPGHIGIVAEAYPDLITGWGSAPWTSYCAEPPCGQFRLNEPKVDDFLDKLMDDLLPRLSPYSAYFHTGGDEVNFNVYWLDPSVGTNDSAVITPLLQKFTDNNHARVRKAGLVPFVWEEIPVKYNVTIGDDVIVQSWLGADAVASLTANGHKVIDSNYNFWYLDCGRGQFITFENGAPVDAYYPFNDWCGPTKSWQLIYSHDPVANLTEEQAKLVLGGEVAVWAELIDDQNFDSIVWPRASAMGEVLWSGRLDDTGTNRSAVEAAPRLADLRERMVARGIGASPLHMVFCTQGGNGSTCEWPESAAV
ncbi:glycoside hydrolase superfamily [Truncatella angustata]|uniref:Beta-hexosaminidase n=1 Tax=Truncatella angustata TaxID=152316 RepID=A0A9P8UC73_9PEZI|nr:glycoside hydrolase superfamily [Truncatella angustata]KAH6646356.1 glycoside hydrolase superfamily [Truncatella angustata]